MVAVLERARTSGVGNGSRKFIYKRPDVYVDRGDIWLVRLDGTEGSEQGGIRPCVVISNSKGNKFGTTVIVAAISSQVHKAKLPTHVLIDERNGLDKASVIMLEQVRTVDKSRLMHKITTLDKNTMDKVKHAHMISCTDMFD